MAKRYMILKRFNNFRLEDNFYDIDCKWNE